MTTHDTQRGKQGEQDWPDNHAASSAYNGSGYVPPEPLFTSDWDEGHPARGGANVPKDWREQSKQPAGEAEKG